MVVTTRLIRLNSCAIAMTSLFGIACVRCGPVDQWWSFDSVVAGSIFNGGDHCIHCRMSRAVFAGFSGHGNSIYCSRLIPKNGLFYFHLRLVREMTARETNNKENKSFFFSST